MVALGTAQGVATNPRNGDPFKAYLLSRGRTPDTARRYARAFAGFECWCRDENLRPVAVTSADISRWLQDQDGLPAYAVQRRLAALRGYYAYAVSTGLRPDDPAKAGRLKMLVPLASATDPNLERLLAEAEAVDGEKEEQPEEVDRPLDMPEVRRVFAQVLDALGSAIGMNASVNELLRQAALFVELEGWARVGVLERRLRVNRHIAKALVETLRDQGILREDAPNWLSAEQPLGRARQRSLRKTRWNHRRKESRPFICIDCGREYKPTGANQKRCPACRPRVKVALVGLLQN